MYLYLLLVRSASFEILISHISNYYKKKYYGFQILFKIIINKKHLLFSELNSAKKHFPFKRSSSFAIIDDPPNGLSGMPPG